MAVDRIDLDLRMPGGKDAEDLIGKALADRRDPLKVEGDFLEFIQGMDQPLGLGAGDVFFPFLKEFNRDLTFFELVVFIGVRAEDLRQLPRGAGTQFKNDARPLASPDVRNKKITDAIVLDQPFVMALDRQPVGDLGGEEDALAGMSFRCRRLLALEQVLQAFHFTCQPFLGADVFENADPLVGDVELNRLGELADRDVDEGRFRMIDRVVDHLREGVVEERARVVREFPE